MIYASTACVAPRRDLWETLGAYRDAGIAAVELGETRLDDATGLAERLSATGLELAVHNYFPPPADPFVLNLASPDAAIRTRSIDHARRAIDLCAAIGAPFYSVHGGFVVDPAGFAGGSFTFPDPAPGAAEAASERYADAYSELLDAGGAARVTVLVENNVCTPALRGKLLLQSAGEFLALVERVPSTRLLVDTGHLNVSGQTLGFTPADFVEALRQAIGAWHLHGNDGLSDAHEPAGPEWWAMRMLDRDTPIVVEARFRDDEELAAYVAALASQST